MEVRLYDTPMANGQANTSFIFEDSLFLLTVREQWIEHQSVFIGKKADVIAEQKSALRC
ncbi:hypothetical protein [uncultured Shewanella sp.]|uniref:hypothetical protein n=1 Tax=uncultured Shewanella sp. TaxID=173975 RepID=UPI00262E62D3|nr:hypothetical protein [uncultured Shewanella sp.]